MGIFIILILVIFHWYAGKCINKRFCIEDKYASSQTCITLTISVSAPMSLLRCKLFDLCFISTTVVYVMTLRFTDSLLLCYSQIKLCSSTIQKSATEKVSVWILRTFKRLTNFHLRNALPAL